MKKTYTVELDTDKTLDDAIFYDDHLPTMRKNFTKMIEKYAVVENKE